MAICPDCTLLVRPIFSDESAVDAQVPSATPAQLAESIVDVIDAGARILNLSVALVGSSARGGGELEEALNHAARRGVIVAAAAGNQAHLSGSTVTRHPWVIPVVACDRRGRPTGESNIGLAIGRRGLGAPGTHVATLGLEGATQTFHGTSAAAPFVSGTAALLWSLFPTASATDIKSALVGSSAGARRAIVPPLLDASAAYERLRAVHGRN
jgi:subtilisin family serine protease